MVTKILGMAMLSSVVGCATVPDDAPQEFHNAQASIEKLDDKDVDDYLPDSVERANRTFSQALNLLEESREEGAMTSQDTAIQKAEKSKQTADGALLIHQKILAWDKNESNFQSALAMIEAGGQPVIVSTGTLSPFAKLENSEVVSSVAYFQTNSANQPIYNADEFESLAKILKKDGDWSVILTGYADQRGPKSYNKELALNRAKAVATDLQNRGVNIDQITYQSVGEDRAQAEAGNSAMLQLDRKVQAKIIF